MIVVEQGFCGSWWRQRNQVICSSPSTSLNMGTFQSNIKMNVSVVNYTGIKKD